MKYFIIAAMGAMGAVLANRGIAVFNDGLRPILPQYFDRLVRRKELATMSFALSFGLVIGYGIPMSIAASIIVIHCLLLFTDLIGCWCSDSWLGTLLAGTLGAAYGLGLVTGLDAVVNFFAALPYDFLSDLSDISSYIVTATAIIPGVAIGYQHGAAVGTAATAAIIMTYFVCQHAGVIAPGGDSIVLNATGTAMSVGIVMMLALAAREKGQSHDHAALTTEFSSRLARLRENAPLLAVMGGLIATGSSMQIIAGDSASLALLSQEEYTGAALTAFARALGFIPLIFTTAIVTGVYAPAGCTFVFVVGFLFHGEPLLAFLGGAGTIVLELLLIQVTARGMDHFPGIKEMGDHIRTSMNQVVELSLIVGSIVAAEKMSAAAAHLPGVGALFVIAAVLLNRQSEQSIVEMTIGPVACIVFGVTLNILLLTGLLP